MAQQASAALNQLAERQMKDAANQIDQARNQQNQPGTDPAKQAQATAARNQQLDQAQQNQQNAADKLDELAAKMGEAVVDYPKPSSRSAICSISKNRSPPRATIMLG